MNTELSDREQEILRLVATGASNKEIAHQLVISPNTVKVHLRNIFEKIEVASRTEAAMYAVNAGLLPGSQPETGRGDGGEPESSVGVPGAEVRKSLARRLWFPISLTVFALGAVAAVLFWRSAASPVNQPVSSSSVGWQDLPPLPTGRSGLAVAVYENKIYTVGGQTSQGVSDTLEVYDIASQTWSDRASKPLPVTEIQAAVIGGKIYVPGGRLGSGEVTDAMEVYDPLHDQWSEAARMPQRTSAYALAAFEGKLYLFGGTDGSNFLSTVLAYNPDEDAWTYKSGLSQKRAFAAAALAGGRIYIFGGYDGRRALDLVEAYSPEMDDGADDPWEVEPSLPGGRYGMGCASVMDVIYLVGGEGDGKGSPPSLAFSPQSGEWQTIPQPGPENYAHMGLVISGTHAYAIGGGSGGQPTDTNLSFQVLYVTVLPFIPE